MDQGSRYIHLSKEDMIISEIVSTLIYLHTLNGTTFSMSVIP